LCMTLAPVNNLGLRGVGGDKSHPVRHERQPAPQRIGMCGGILPRSMSTRSGPFRSILTLILALAVPFCCCDLRALLTGCISCESATSGGGRSVGVQPGDGHDCGGHGHCHGDAPSGTDQDGSTPGKEPVQDSHDCSCGKTTGKMLTVEKSTIELPAPVLVAILDWSATSDPRLFDAYRGREVDLRVRERLATSLLRMHCALIV
jgi:hypothetical protein